MHSKPERPRETALYLALSRLSGQVAAKREVHLAVHSPFIYYPEVVVHVGRKIRFAFRLLVEMSKICMRIELDMRRLIQAIVMVTLKYKNQFIYY